MAARTFCRAAAEGIADAPIPTAQAAGLTLHGTPDGASPAQGPISSLACGTCTTLMAVALRLLPPPPARTGEGGAWATARSLHWKRTQSGRRSVGPLPVSTTSPSKSLNAPVKLDGLTLNATPLEDPCVTLRA